MKAKKVLIIDDDAKLRALLTEYLEGYGFEVACLEHGNDAPRSVREADPSVVILDVMMPGKDGMEVLGDIRAQMAVPVIMLTAKGEDMDRVVGLELGADDYMAKPFNPRELLARIRAVLRRTAASGPEPAGEEPSLIEAGGIALDTLRRQLVIDGHASVIGPTEAKLLAVFMRSPDTPLSREELMDKVWGRDFAAYDRTIDVHISKLRTELRKFDGHADRIQTVWGTGYLFRSTP